MLPRWNGTLWQRCLGRCQRQEGQHELTWLGMVRKQKENLLEGPHSGRQLTETAERKKEMPHRNRGCIRPIPTDMHTLLVLPGQLQPKHHTPPKK